MNEDPRTLRWRRSAVWLCSLALGLASLGCNQLKMKAALERLNASAPKEGLPPRLSTAERVARLAARHFTDSYYDTARVNGWLEAAARDPRPLLDLFACIAEARRQSGSVGACHARFSAPDGPLRSWGLPEAVPTTGVASQGEIDAERFIANGRALGAALSELEQGIAGGLPDAAAGVADGARRAGRYLAARSWKRGERPTTALVLGGGSANGAFSAGFVYRLMEVLTRCRSAPAGGCPKARLDLAVGTSTGTLIGALVDLFATPGHEREAMGLLVDNYTCSVEADLYCVPDEYFWKIVHDARGVVRFDGIASKIDRFIVPEVERNALELVGVSVDLTYGDVVGFSDQDPADATVACGRRDALLASIVLPVLAEPVDSVALRSGTRRGPFVDGGVSSIVPMLEAVRRGAERVVVLSNYPMDTEPAAPPRNAFDVLTRTLSLAMLIPGASEMERAELLAVSRRLLEHDVCRERFARWGSDPAGSEAFCRRKFAGSGGPDPAAGWTGASRFPEIETSFRSAWVFRTENALETAQGYAFDPAVMRPLFALGVEAFQKRCNEILDVLAVEGSVARGACAETDASARIARLFKPANQCPLKELRECGAPVACTRR